MAKRRKSKQRKKANVEHFITQFHLKKSGGQGAHTSKKVYNRKKKHKRKLKAGISQTE